MIVANLATYPKRRDHLAAVIAAIAPQVDRLNLVLNQYEAVLPEFAGVANLNQILPDEDTKDVGKFYPDTSGADWVFMIDDDMNYPPDYVARSLSAMKALAPRRVLGGYHGSLYYRPGPTLRPKRLIGWLRWRRERIADYRRPLRFREALERPTVVDQIATNAAVIAGADMPPYSFMAGSQKFVDVRLARWCHEKGILPVCLPRAAGWLSEERYEETIFRDFTRQNPPHVAEEIWTYAMQVPGRGEALDVVN